MSDYTELVKALRETSIDFGELDDVSVMLLDAAAAIEELQAEVKRLELDNEDYKHENRRLNGEIEALQSEMDILKVSGREAYFEGLAAQPHWVSVEEPPKGNGAFAACCVYDGKIYWFKAIYLDGKWLREMDGLELPVNYWLEIPQPPQEVQE